MKQRFLAMVLLVLIAPISWAADPQQTIAVVNMERVMNESEKGKALGATLRKFMSELSEKMKVLVKELRDKQAKLQRDGNFMNDAQRAQLNQQIQQLRMQYQQIQTDTQRQASKKQQEIVMKLNTAIDAIIKKLADLKGIDMVLNSATVNSPILFINNKLDITNTVIQQYDAQ